MRSEIFYFRSIQLQFKLDELGELNFNFSFPSAHWKELRFAPEISLINDVINEMCSESDTNGECCIRNSIDTSSFLRQYNVRAQD